MTIEGLAMRVYAARAALREAGFEVPGGWQVMVSSEAHDDLIAEAKNRADYLDWVFPGPNGQTVFGLPVRVEPRFSGDHVVIRREVVI